jgi:hypothetical protein
MKKITLLLSVLFFGSINVFATHNLAGDISYKHIASSTTAYRYGVTIRTYTNTAGTIAPDRCYLMVYFGDGDSAVAPRINGPQGDGSTCDSVYHMGVTLVGFDYVKENIYYIEHSYTGPGTYNISMSDRNRANVCNIPMSVNTLYTFKATLVINGLFGANSAPAYNIVPVRYFTIGVPAFYNPFVIETEGDSLFYEELIPVGVTGYTFPSFSSMFYIDNYSGMITWDSPNMICNYVYDIKISEYRKVGGTWYFMGSTMQDVWNTVSSMPAGVAENTSDVSVNVFPNPASEVINFRINNTEDVQKYSLVITNSLGQIISNTDFTENTLAINTENNLDKGVYFYELRKQSGLVQRGKFVLCGSSFK